jgi:hypothetical protein
VIGRSHADQIWQSIANVDCGRGDWACRLVGWMRACRHESL